MGWFDRDTSSSSEDDNPGGNSNTDAGDLGATDPAQEQARQDYENSVGSDTHEQEVADAREGAGFDDPRSDED